MSTAALDQQQQQQEEEGEEEEEEEGEEAEEEGGQAQEQPPQQQEKELKPQDHVPLKSDTKGGGDVVDDVEEEEAQIAGVDIVLPVTSGDVHIDKATGPTAGAVNGMFEATTELSGDMPVYEMKAKAEKVGKQQVPAKATVRITGATGNLANEINGMYEATTEISGGMPVYAKVGNSDRWLEYHAANSQWQVKFTCQKGEDGGLAVCAVPAKCLPEKCPAGCWQVFDVTEWGLQPAVTISEVTQGDVDAFLAEVQSEAAHVVKGSQHVRFTGAMGSNAGDINGVYRPTEELCGNISVYRKVDDDDMWLEYNPALKQWQVKPTISKGKDGGWAICAVPVKCLPEKCAPGQWVVADGDMFYPQPAITISEVTQGEVEAYLTDAGREAALVVKGSHNIRIAGATGPTADDINGIYKPTEELCGNATVYVKADDGDLCFEYNTSCKQWQVKCTGDKGTCDGYACCGVPAKCLPEECPLGKWRVYDGRNFSPQPAVTITVQHDNGDAVSADDDDAKPKAAATKVESGLAAAPIAGIGTTNSVASGGVRIVGAMGPNAGRINGIYEATTELSGDIAVYVKVGNGDMWLEYRDALKEWQVKPTAFKGEDVGLSFCAVPAKCLPERCPAGQWQIRVNEKCVLLPAIAISVVTQEEVDAHRSKVEEEDARVVNGSHDITFSGATGIYADDINGVYKPTLEFCDNATVYVKVGDGKMWLEYNASSKHWKVKSTVHTGKNGSLAFCAVPGKCLPEECPRGKWIVGDGTKWVPQHAVTISVRHYNNDAVRPDDDDEAKPKAAAMKVESGAQTASVGITGHFKTSVSSGGVRIVGAMGPHAGRINGIYEATNELSGDLPIYAKVGDPYFCLEYRADRNQWQVKSTAHKGKGGCLAFCAVLFKCLPEGCPAGQWQICVNDNDISLPAIVIAVVSQEEVDAYRAQVEEEAARVLRGIHDVTITGATGTYAGSINGVYRPTVDFCDNANVYIKVGDGNMWLEYRAAKKQWQVKPTFRKGLDVCLACCVVPAKCLPEECPRGKWLVDNGTKFGPQQTITISVQHDNNGAASAGDDDEAKPKAAAMKVESGAAAVSTTGVGIASPVTLGAVRVIGAMSPTAGAVNGIYEATTELSGDMPVYVKVGSRDMLLEYCATIMSWQVKPTSQKGKNGGWACCTVPAKCLPEDCPRGKWKVSDGGQLVRQPTVTASVVTQDEVEAYLADVKSEAARVVKGTQHVRITGATGPKAGSINGMYRPTQELSDNVTVYVKIDDGDMLLEYRALIKDWQVKHTAHKGKDISFAFCAVPAKCLPDKCPVGQWQVVGGDKYGPQPAITIKQKKRER